MKKKWSAVNSNNQQRFNFIETFTTCVSERGNILSPVCPFIHENCMKIDLDLGLDGIEGQGRRSYAKATC